MGTNRTMQSSPTGTGRTLDGATAGENRDLKGYAHTGGDDLTWDEADRAWQDYPTETWDDAGTESEFTGGGTNRAMN